MCDPVEKSDKTVVKESSEKEKIILGPCGQKAGTCKGLWKNEQNDLKLKGNEGVKEPAGQVVVANDENTPSNQIRERSQERRRNWQNEDRGLDRTGEFKPQNREQIQERRRNWQGYLEQYGPSSTLADGQTNVPMEERPQRGPGMGRMGQGMGRMGQGMGGMGQGMGQGMGGMGQGMGRMGQGMEGMGQGMGQGMGRVGQGMGCMGQGMGRRGQGLGQGMGCGRCCQGTWS